MSTDILEFDGGPLCTSKITVTGFACTADVVENRLSTSRRSVFINIRRGNNLNPGETKYLVKEQAITLAESILEYYNLPKAETTKLKPQETVLFYNLLKQEIERQSPEERKLFGYEKIAKDILKSSIEDRFESCHSRFFKEKSCKKKH